MTLITTSKALLLLSVATLLNACSTVPLTGRSQASLVSETEMQQAASLQYREFLNDPKIKVINNTPQSKKVKEIGAKIAAAVTKYMNNNGYAANIANYQWEFNLVDSKDVNAWCMPGGKVAVYTGILPVTLTDAGLATVMGHEIAHAIAHHSSERYSQGMIAQGVGALLGAAVTKSETGTQVFQQLYGIGSQAGYLLPNSRKQESEADRLGLTFMAMAGYNPQNAVSFWERMAAQKKGGQAPPEFLSTHPSDDTRISDIQKYIPEANKYYGK
ncbi:MAG: M48 family peptidase [Sphingobacteriales bacterium]|nr:MAG: M48 family peptidase [Sphingobacteriales bacterium]